MPRITAIGSGVDRIAGLAADVQALVAHVVKARHHALPPANQPSRLVILVPLAAAGATTVGGRRRCRRHRRAGRGTWALEAAAPLVWHRSPGRGAWPGRPRADWRTRGASTSNLAGHRHGSQRPLPAARRSTWPTIDQIGVGQCIPAHQIDLLLVVDLGNRADGVAGLDRVVARLARVLSPGGGLTSAAADAGVGTATGAATGACARAGALRSSTGARFSGIRSQPACWRRRGQRARPAVRRDIERGGVAKSPDCPASGPRTGTPPFRRTPDLGGTKSTASCPCAATGSRHARHMVHHHQHLAAALGHRATRHPLAPVAAARRAAGLHHRRRPRCCQTGRAHPGGRRPRSAGVTGRRTRPRLAGPAHGGPARAPPTPRCARQHGQHRRLVAAAGADPPAPGPDALRRRRPTLEQQSDHGGPPPKAWRWSAHGRWARPCPIGLSRQCLVDKLMRGTWARASSTRSSFRPGAQPPPCAGAPTLNPAPAQAAASRRAASACCPRADGAAASRSGLGRAATCTLWKVGGKRLAVVMPASGRASHPGGRCRSGPLEAA